MHSSCSSSINKNNFNYPYDRSALETHSAMPGAQQCRNMRRITVLIPVRPDILFLHESPSSLKFGVTHSIYHQMSRTKDPRPPTRLCCCATPTPNSIFLQHATTTTTTSMTKMQSITPLLFHSNQFTDTASLNRIAKIHFNLRKR